MNAKETVLICMNFAWPSKMFRTFSFSFLQPCCNMWANTETVPLYIFVYKGKKQQKTSQIAMGRLKMSMLLNNYRESRYILKLDIFNIVSY